MKGGEINLFAQYYWDWTGKIFGEGPMNWGQGQPISGIRPVSCVAMKGAYDLPWFNTDCNDKKLFVCEEFYCQNRQNVKNISMDVAPAQKITKASK